jgi:tRNA (cmo5U34)-methyltransferase
VTAEVWKQRDVAAAFLNERSLLIPDRPRQFDVLLRLLRFLPRPPESFLDLGSGDGILLAAVLEAYPQASGVAVDFSPLMLEQCRQRLATFGSRVRIVEADLGSPDWFRQLTAPFPAVISGFAIHHLIHERKRQLYREIYQLLTPDGIFINTEHVSSPSPSIEAMFDDAMTDHLYQRRREKGEEITREQVKRDFLERPDRAANILAPLEEQCAWLREIGFREVDCFWKYFELAIFGGRR